MARRHYDWDALIERLQERPGRWTLEYPNDSPRLAKRIRLRQHPQLRRDDGVVEVSMLNRYGRGAAARGDIWVRWIPTAHTSRNEQESP
jgi:hypothetical protein